ncbi:hypothetical protein I7F13_04950 [Sinorhizobium meliloti]|nr:hypothetical protein [Sinorhizobium meliloti]
MADEILSYPAGTCQHLSYPVDQLVSSGIDCDHLDSSANICRSLEKPQANEPLPMGYHPYIGWSPVTG